MKIGRIQGEHGTCFKIPETSMDHCIDAVKIGRKVYIRVGHGVDGDGNYDLFREAHPVVVKLQRLRRRR